MRITSIELAGSSDTTLGDGTPGLPRAFARIARKNGSDQIEITILSASGETNHTVAATDTDGMWLTAKAMQHRLDGYIGNNSEINDYYRIIQKLAD